VIEVEVAIELTCAECGDALVARAEERYGKHLFRVEPCEKCRQAAYDSGLDEGMERLEDEDNADNVVERLEDEEAGQ